MVQDCSIIFCNNRFSTNNSGLQRLINRIWLMRYVHIYNDLTEL